jgi:hypothetical protein
MTTEFGSPTDMVYKDTLRAEEYRRTVEQVDLFNAASGGAIVLESDPARQMALGGDFTDTARWKAVESLISHRDNNNPGVEVSVKKLEMTGGKNVTQTLGCGPVSVTDIQVRKAGNGFDLNSAMVNLGQQFADAKILTIRNNLISAAVAGVSNVSAHVLNMARGKTAGAKVTASFANINTLLAKMGDAREEIVAFLMPSAVFADLVGDSIANYQFDRVAGVTIYQDVVQAFGRSVIVADIPALVSEQASSYHTEYGLLGLGKGALRGTVVYDQGIEVQREITRESNLTFVREDFDVEYEAYGLKWTSATSNPTDAELATAGNWGSDFDNHRELKIVHGVFNASI